MAQTRLNGIVRRPVFRKLVSRTNLRVASAKYVTRRPSFGKNHPPLLSAQFWLVDLDVREACVTSEPDFERFYEAEARSVFSAVYSLCRDRVLAEDATQEAFARALERWDRLGSDPWAGGWVATTALNVARRGLRRSRIHPPASDQQANPEEAVDLWERVRVLPRRQQEVVVLYYRLQMTVEEIARVLRIREGTVRTHLVRAREGLRSALGEATDGD